MNDPEITESTEPVADTVDEADFELQRRAWLRVITPLLATRSHDADPSPRVQLAYDLLHIAACERASRILRSDLVDEPPPPC